MSATKKREMIELVRRAPQPKRATIAELGLARSMFYRWQRRFRDQGEAGITDRKPGTAHGSSAKNRDDRVGFSWGNSPIRV